MLVSAASSATWKLTEVDGAISPTAPLLGKKEAVKSSAAELLVLF